LVKEESQDVSAEDMGEDLGEEHPDADYLDE